MKKAILIAALSVLLASPALAQRFGVLNPFETIDEARQRHNAERYDYFQRQMERQPSGLIFSYPSDKFGDNAPFGTDEPGKAQPYWRYHHRGF